MIGIVVAHKIWQGTTGVNRQPRLVRIYQLTPDRTLRTARFPFDSP